MHVFLGDNRKLPFAFECVQIAFKSLKGPPRPFVSKAVFERRLLVPVTLLAVLVGWALLWLVLCLMLLLEVSWLTVLDGMDYFLFPLGSSIYFLKITLSFVFVNRIFLICYF